eukprot:CAMPEP_0114995612 /NCGR_PEP_ID=MMETSP0216-20121206/13830_1 /TAXON_ID=223996 /ORGANISM="Protocruzia adherens, Strain Boccale" /LENGTH=371 /DNA_ID=CAMNT_0002359681 /DNA_START=300 /DNA_END=1415 /DNA_ORIENTATION=+
MWNYNKKKNSGQSNVEFYRGQLGINDSSRGMKIDEFLQTNVGNYEKLEADHAYVQWLFPNHYESRFNWSSVSLGYDEAKIFREDREIAVRFVQAYQLFLDFLGMRLVDFKTGELARSDDYKERFTNVVWHGHNFLRMRRLTASLSVTGFFDYAVQFIGFMRYEAFGKKTAKFILNQINRKPSGKKSSKEEKEEKSNSHSRYGYYGRPRDLGDDPFKGQVGDWDADFWDVYYPGDYTPAVKKELKLKNESELTPSVFFSLSEAEQSQAKLRFRGRSTATSKQENHRQIDTIEEAKREDKLSDVPNEDLHHENELSGSPMDSHYLESSCSPNREDENLASGNLARLPKRHRESNPSESRGDERGLDHPDMLEH